MSDAIRPQPGIMDIALYEGGKASVAGVTNILKLSSNENPFGASDKAKDAFARSVHQLHRYPSTDHLALRTAIAEVHGLDAARVICGVGSDEIIHFLCQAYAGPKDEVVFTEHGFLMYRIRVCDFDFNGIEYSIIEITNRGMKTSGKPIHSLGNLAKSIRAMPHGIESTHVCKENLRGTDIGCRLIATNMLFASLQC